MTSKYAYTLLSSERSTRVILLQPDPNRQADLYCQLQNVELNDDAPPYTALSYVWGSVPRSKPLHCGGKLILITPSCETALRHLRDATRVVTLWVDAVCINQDDVSERNHQVSLMAHIYRKADTVAIWLGLERPRMGKCFSRMGLAVKMVKNRSWLYQVTKGSPTLKRLVFKLITGGATMDDLHYLYASDWATRVWTVQELALASRPMVMCGMSQVPWRLFNDFFDIITILLPDYERPEYDLYYHIWLSREKGKYLVDVIDRLPISRWGRFAATRKLLGLIMCVLLSNYNDCFDPRDKVYGMYGVLVDLLDQLPDVDYNKSENKLYEDFTRATIKSTGKFWPAYLTNSRVVTFGSGIPSWVINFSPKARNTRSTMAGNNWLTQILEILSATATATFYSTINFSTFQRSGSDTLVLSGVSYTKIRNMSSFWPALDEYNELAQLMVIVSWLSFCFNHRAKLSEIYGPKERRFEVLLQLVAATDQPRNPNTFRRQFVAVVEWYRELFDLDDSDEDSAEQFNQWLRRFFDIKDRRECLSTISLAMADHVLFHTDTGHIGTISATIEQDDEVVLVAGSDWPVVLRQHGDYWHYVGSCRIQGIMDGEAWPRDTNTDDMPTFILV